MGLYLRNGNQYLESMIAGYRARVAPFNVNYRYVEEELLYLLIDADARGLVYAAEFAPQVATIRERLPQLRVLIQVADESGNALLPGAVDYESIVATPAPASGMPEVSGDDLYILYTGGTARMPKACCGGNMTSSCRPWAAARWVLPNLSTPTPELAELALAKRRIQVSAVDSAAHARRGAVGYLQHHQRRRLDRDPGRCPPRRSRIGPSTR